MAYIIVNAQTHDENIESRVEFAVIEVTPALVERVKKTQETFFTAAKLMGEQPMHLDIHDCAPDFYNDSATEIDMYTQEKIELLLHDKVGEGYITVDGLALYDDTLSLLETNTEACCLRIHSSFEDSVRWFGYLKHTNVTFATELIKIEDLEKALVG